MLEANIPAAWKTSTSFSTSFSFRLAKFTSGDFVDLNNQFLYAPTTWQVSDDAMLEAIIGADFRFSCINMTFSADVLTQAGYTVPKGRKLSRGDSLTSYYKVLSRLPLRRTSTLAPPPCRRANPG